MSERSELIHEQSWISGAAGHRVADVCVHPTSPVDDVTEVNR